MSDIKLRDPDNDQLYLADNVEAIFGSGADINDASAGDLSMRWDGTDFDVTFTTANSSWVWGTSGDGVDMTWHGDTAGSYMLWDQSADALILNGAGLSFTGTTDNGISMTGTYTDHVIDIQPAATLGDYKAFYVGTWGTEAGFNDGGGLFRIYGKVGSGGTASANMFIRTLTDSTSPPIGMQLYTDCDTTATGPLGMSALDCFTVLNAGSVLAAGSSWLDSMHSGWFKVQGSATATCNGMVAPVWVDNQMSCAVGQEEFGVIMTTGGTRPDGAFGFETSSSGYDQLFYFDSTFNSGAGTCVTTDAVPGGNQDARIKVYYNGTQYYIPLYR